MKKPGRWDARRWWVAPALVCAMVSGVGMAQTRAGGKLVGVRARLEKNLDAKNAKAGSTVLAKPEVKIHIADGLDLDTGSLLLGHVDKVQPSVDRGDSAIAVTFDRVRMKGGREVAIKATILWIGQPPDQLNPTLHSAAADRTTPGVGVEAGGSANGNLVPVQQGYAGSEIAGAATQMHRLGNGLGTGLPEGMSAQRNAIAGVNFFSDMGRSDSGWFRSKRRNVSVPGGTVLAFAIVLLPDAGATP
jgi:hypothetical protein